jgi:hypothetical protein
MTHSYDPSHMPAGERAAFSNGYDSRDEEVAKLDDMIRLQRAEIKCQRAMLTKLRVLVFDMLVNDPTGTVADGGVSMLDAWRKDAKRVLGFEP